MRFRKSVRIAKGVRLNLSKSGISATVGVRGASVNVGKRGTYLNTGIPGTGLYDRHKIAGGSNQSQKSSASRNAIILPSSISIGIDHDGTIVIMDESNIPITDEVVLRKIKKTDSYKNQVSLMMNQFKYQIENESRKFVEIYKLSSMVTPISTFQKILDDLKPNRYIKDIYSEIEPSNEIIRSQLEDEAKEKVKTIAFWKIKRLRNKYVEDEILSRFSSAYTEWKTKKDDFEKIQIDNELRMNEKYQKEYELERTKLLKSLEGNRGFIENEINEWISSIELPVEFNIQFSFIEESCNLMIDLDLPEIEEMPSEKATQMANGKVKRKPKTQKEIKYDYVCCVLGQAIFFSSNFFNISPAIIDIIASGYTQRRNKKTGDMQDDYIFSIKFNRSIFEKADFEEIDVLEFVNGFENRLILTQTFELKTIIPF